MRISDGSSYVCSAGLPKAFFLPRGELLDRHSKTPRCTPRDPALAVCTVQLAHDRSPFISASAPFLAPRCWIETIDRCVIRSAASRRSQAAPLHLAVQYGCGRGVDHNLKGASLAVKAVRRLRSFLFRTRSEERRVGKGCVRKCS